MKKFYTGAITLMLLLWRLSGITESLQAAMYNISRFGQIQKLSLSPPKLGNRINIQFPAFSKEVSWVFL
jgi:hypothetical protein